MTVDLSRQKKLDTDSKAIQHIEFVGQLKNIDKINADRAESMFVWTIKKNQRNKINMFSRMCNSTVNKGKLLRREG